MADHDSSTERRLSGFVCPWSQARDTTVLSEAQVTMRLVSLLIILTGPSMAQLLFFSLKATMRRKLREEDHALHSQSTPTSILHSALSRRYPSRKLVTRVSNVHQVEEADLLIQRPPFRLLVNEMIDLFRCQGDHRDPLFAAYVLSPLC